MFQIISKSHEPRKEDTEAQRFIAENRSKIHGIANHLTGGGWSQLRRPFTGPGFETTSARRQPTRSGEPEPYVRISPNRRVVIVDAVTSRQLHFIGQVRSSDGMDHLVLATRDNGFFGPLEESVREQLADLDGFSLPDSTAEEELKRIIGARLGFASSSDAGG